MHWMLLQCNRIKYFSTNVLKQSLKYIFLAISFPAEQHYRVALTKTSKRMPESRGSLLKIETWAVVFSTRGQSSPRFCNDCPSRWKSVSKNEGNGVEDSGHVIWFRYTGPEEKSWRWQRWRCWGALEVTKRWFAPVQNRDNGNTVRRTQYGTVMWET